MFKKNLSYVMKIQQIWCNHQQIFEGQCFITTSHAHIVLFFFFFGSFHPNRSLRTLFNIFKLEICNLTTICIWRCERVPPLSNAQVWNFWAKDMGWSEVLLGTCLGGGGGNYWELIENFDKNTLRTWWEHIWN
jgi:hypothetical protein